MLGVLHGVGIPNNGPHNVDRCMRVQNGEQSLYMLHRGGHYDLVLQTGQSGVAASAEAGEKRQSGNAGEPPSKRLWGVSPAKMVNRYQNSRAENANPNKVVSVSVQLRTGSEIVFLIRLKLCAFHIFPSMFSNTG